MTSTNKPPRRNDLRDQVRALALVDSNVIFSRHAGDRMFERGISDRDVIRVLQKGFAKDDIEETAPGEWKCTMVYGAYGDREIGVVTVLKTTQKLVIVTVEWEDLK